MKINRKNGLVLVAASLLMALAAVPTVMASSYAPIHAPAGCGACVPLAHSDVCLTATGYTILCPLADSHSPTGFVNGAGLAVNADGTLYLDAHNNQVVVR